VPVVACGLNNHDLAARLPRDRFTALRVEVLDPDLAGPTFLEEALADPVGEGVGPGVAVVGGHARVHALQTLAIGALVVNVRCRRRAEERLGAQGRELTASNTSLECASLIAEPQERQRAVGAPPPRPEDGRRRWLGGRSRGASRPFQPTTTTPSGAQAAIDASATEVAPAGLRGFGRRPPRRGN